MDTDDDSTSGKDGEWDEGGRSTGRRVDDTVDDARGLKRNAIYIPASDEEGGQNWSSKDGKRKRQRSETHTSDQRRSRIKVEPM